jgi:hypothetical protein
MRNPPGYRYRNRSHRERPRPTHGWVIRWVMFTAAACGPRHSCRGGPSPSVGDHTLRRLRPHLEDHMHRASGEGSAAVSARRSARSTLVCSSRGLHRSRLVGAAMKPPPSHSDRQACHILLPRGGPAFEPHPRERAPHGPVDAPAHATDPTAYVRGPRASHARPVTATRENPRGPAPGPPTPAPASPRSLIGQNGRRTDGLTSTGAQRATRS